MYCSKCGKENPDDNRFCEFCGAEMIDSGEKAALFHNKKRKGIFIAAVSGLIIFAIIVSLALFFSSGNKAEYNAKIDEADRYMEELDYDRAEAAYLEAIKIDPKEEEAYLKVADIYMNLEQYDDAEKILQNGQENAGGEAIEEKLKEVRKSIEENTFDPWGYFMEICTIGKMSGEIEMTYGDLNMRNSGAYTTWADFTNFNPSYYFIDDETPLFSFDDEQGFCDGMAGTAEQLFGIKEETTIQTLSENINPDSDFEVIHTTDVLKNNWRGKKTIGEKRYMICIYPDSFENMYYKEQYDPFNGNSVPKVTMDNLTTVFQEFKGDPFKIYPSTNVVIFDMESACYEIYSTN